MTALPLLLSDVHMSFGAKEVLRGLSGEIPLGEIFAIMGPSGSGKTTVLRLLDLLDVPERGEVLIHGRRFPTGSPEALEQRRRMAMVPQNPIVFRATAFDNVAYGLWLRSLPEPEIRGRVFSALAFVGLLDAAKHRADRLSGGEQQRIAFARAAVLNPEILFLDEFTANLDPTNVRLLEDAIVRYRKETGCTIVIVTHNVFQARRLADRVALLLDGRFVEIGPASDFFERPSRPETRAFLTGQMAY